jgi:low temperature requirement protein LtrA
LNFKHCITISNSHYCCCKRFELLFLLWLFWKQTLEKICTKNVSHQDVIPSGVQPHPWMHYLIMFSITYIFVGGGWSMAHSSMSSWFITFILLVFPFSLYPTSNPP